MKKLPTLKDAGRERRIFMHRTVVASLSMVLLALVILGRLFFLQVVNNEHYTTLSHENRLQVVPLAPPRGLIYSSDGVVLAENKASFSLVAIPEKTEDPGAALEQLTLLLGLEQETVERFEQRVRRARRFENVPLKVNLSDEELAIFAVNRFRFPGFFIESGATRHYPFADATAHVVGYVGRISERDLDEIDQTNYAATTHVGKIGIEKAREDLLHGSVGHQTVEVNAQGRVLRVVERSAPVPGADLYLTLDMGLQRAAIDAMEGRRGAVVALDPATGGVLAFVSNPAFDPNEFVNGIGRELYRSWSTSASRPLFNRALQGQYPPGSTIKPMVALAGLEAGSREAHDTTWCPGWFSLPGDTHRYRDWLKRGHGKVDLVHSIAHSCDVYYYKLAHDLGIRQLHERLSAFGLGSATGIDIPGEAAGLVPSAAWKRRAKQLPWYPGETLIAGIGQGFMLATPLQLAHATSIVANRGEVLIPHFLAQIAGTPSEVEIAPGIYRRAPLRVADEQHWQTVIDGMVAVVHGPTGTARRSGQGAPVQFAGKTGTAQVFGIAQNVDADDLEVPEHLQDHALFVAFAPVEAPQVAIAVVIENGGSGSRAAAPVARRLIDAYFSDSATAALAAHD